MKAALGMAISVASAIEESGNGGRHHGSIAENGASAKGGAGAAKYIGFARTPFCARRQKRVRYHRAAPRIVGDVAARHSARRERLAYRRACALASRRLGG